MMKRIIYIAIPLLAGAILLLPAVHTGHPPSPRYVTQVTLRAYDTALAAYLNEYSKTPTGALAQITATLAGLNTNENRRGLRFIEQVPITKTLFGKVRGGNTDADGNYLDGWYRPIALNITLDGWSLVSSGADGVRNSTDDIVVTRNLHEQRPNMK